MKAKYTHSEFRTTMLLKNMTISGLASELKISRRSVDYFIKGEKKMRKSKEFIEILRPELDSIHRINKRRILQCEEK